MKVAALHMAKLFAVMSLLFAVFIVAPTADASACAPEVPELQQSLHAHSDNDVGNGVGDLGTCAHGHCHHTASERNASQDPDTVLQSPLLRQIRPVNDLRDSRTPDGLMRPPRV